MKKWGRVKWLGIWSMGRKKVIICFFAWHEWTLHVMTGPELVLQHKWEVIAALLLYSHLGTWHASQRDITRESSTQLSLNTVRITVRISLFWGVTDIPLNLCLVRSSSWWISRRNVFPSHRIGHYAHVLEDSKLLLF